MKKTNAVRVSKPLYALITDLVQKNKARNKEENTDRYYPYSMVEFLDVAARYYLDNRKDLKGVCRECGRLIHQGSNNCEHCNRKVS